MSDSHNSPSVNKSKSVAGNQFGQTNGAVAGTGNNSSVSTIDTTTKTVTDDNGNTLSVAKDSGNTKTITADSGNTKNISADNGNTSNVNVTKDAGNTKTVSADNGNTSTVNLTKDSDNTKNIDSGNTKTIDSNNDTDISKTTTTSVSEASSHNVASFDTTNLTKTTYDHSYDTTNFTKTVDIGVDLSHMFNDYDNQDGSTLVMPENITQSISSGDHGQSIGIAMDQVNSLVANNNASDDWVQNTANNAINSQPITATGGSADHNHGTDNQTSDAHGAASLDAFTQSIVLGANLQYNNFSLSVVGHDSAADGSHIGHS